MNHFDIEKEILNIKDSIKADLVDDELSRIVKSSKAGAKATGGRRQLDELELEMLAAGSGGIEPEPAELFFQKLLDELR